MFCVPFQEVAVRKDTHDVVHRVLVHGQAGMTLAVQHLHQVFERCIHVDSAHVHARGHDFAYRSLHEVEDIEDHLLFLFLEAFIFTIGHVGEVSLDGVAHFFGQETQLGIVPEEVEQLHEHHVTELCRGHERETHQPKQRHENNRQRIGLEACNQVRDKHGQHVQHGTGNNQVCRHRDVGVRFYQGDVGIAQHKEAKHASTHVAEDAPDGHALVKAVPFNDVRNFLFALVAFLGVTFSKYKAERALGRREHRRCQDKHAKENDGKYFGVFHYLPSLYRSSPRNSHSRLRITLRSAALMWS